MLTKLIVKSTKTMTCFWRKIAMLSGFVLCASQLAIAGRLELNLNNHWHFKRMTEGAKVFQTNPFEAGTAFDDSSWQSVVLPHTVRIEQPEAAQNYFQGICWYRRHIATRPAWREKNVSLLFEGAMQVADVWVNGRHVLTHRGGYLPFSVDITSALERPEGAVVAVRLNNLDNPDIPPGKPHNQLDFCYFGGLYRDVKLIVTDPLHITDAATANRMAGGGIFVRTESATTKQAKIYAQADVVNDGSVETNVAVRFIAISPDGEKIAARTVPLSTFASGAEMATNCELTVPNPKLWHPDHPWLYTLKTEVLRNRKVADEVSTRFGIRTLAYDDKLGFVINGQPLTIRGANRHQDFPWLGNAVPDNAAYRDIKRLKDAGFNFLRLAHYPQSPAVMDACDQLGLMVSVCTPGWQHFSSSEMFTNLALQNIREMVRWHRNHPCVIMWEVSLNETYGHDAFYAECSRVAHEEYPGDQMFTAGDSYASKDVRHYEVPYAGWGGFYHRGAAPGFEGRKRSFAREYGDYEFGGEHSTTRVARGAGEQALLLQTWNFIWSHNQNLAMPWLIGDSLWVGMDHFRGCSQANPISRCGVLDYLRLPKFSYYFFQSQRAVNQPSIFIATYWTPRSSPTKVVVFSNCDEVELFLNGRSLGRHKPDHGPDSAYGVWHPEADPVYMAKGKTVLEDEKQSAADLKQPHAKELRAMFDGGNCRRLDHPPFTFAPVPYQAGELKAVGYVGGKKVCEFIRRTPGSPVALKLNVETCGRDLAADGTDAVFVRARVMDANGETVPAGESAVTFSVKGAGEMISPAKAKTEAGVATLLLRATDKPGKIQITATADGVKSAKTVFHSHSATSETDYESSL